MSCIIGYQDEDCAYVACDGFLGQTNWTLRNNFVKAVWTDGPAPDFIATSGALLGLQIAHSLVENHGMDGGLPDFVKCLREKFLERGWTPSLENKEPPCWDFNALLTDGLVMYDLDQTLAPVEYGKRDFVGIGSCTVAYGAFSVAQNYMGIPEALRMAALTEARYSPHVSPLITVYKISEEGVEEIQ